MSAIHRMRCRLGMHEWRSGICFYCGKKEASTRASGSDKGAAPRSHVSAARLEETQALAGRAAVQPFPPRPAARPLPSSPADKAGAAVQWRVGEVLLDLYEVKEVFESGGMGLVYRVHHRGWNVDLAVKSPRSEHFRTEAQRQRFEAEIEAWIALGLHPHIVSCYYVRTLGGVPRVFAELVPGGTLDAWIRDRRLYAGGREAAQERLLDVAIQIAWAMGYAHTQGAGLVHQDLKPLNVLMTPEGTAKVTDFGLAQARGRAGTTEAASDGRTVHVDGCGLLTPAYASPEQYTPGEKLSRKTDIWSWAVTVLELYLGGLPWDPRISGHVALAHGLEGYLKSGVQDSAIPPLPPALQGLLRECLKPNPAERPADFAAVAERLAGIYRAVVRRDYPRVAPAPAVLQADALSNRAISMLDLGREAEAQALFDQALAQEPGHPQATYNWGLVRWRRGEITDLVLVQQLEQSQANRPGDWMPPYLVGLVHIERRDAAGARAALTAAQKVADRTEVRDALDLVKKIRASAGGCLAVMESHVVGVTSLALSADGHRALSGSETLTWWGGTGSQGKTALLWDLETGGCLRTLEGHTDRVSSVALSADGQQALSGSRDKTLRLWDVDRGKCLKTLVGHTADVRSVALNADSRLALSGSDDHTLRLWDLDNGECLRTLNGHSDVVNAVALSADDRRAVSLGQDGTLRMWDVRNAQCLRVLTLHNASLWTMALSPDGRQVLSGGLDGGICLWNFDGGECLRHLKGHADYVTDVAFSADGRRALSGSADKTVRLWDLDRGLCLVTLAGHTAGVTSVALSGDGRRVLSASWDKTTRLWGIGAWSGDAAALTAPFVVSEVTRAVALLAVQQQFRDLLTQADVASAAGRYADAWRLARQAGSLPGYCFNPEMHQRAYHAGWRGGVRRGLRSARCQKILAGHTEWITAVALSADGHRAISGGGRSIDRKDACDDTLRFWDLERGESLRPADRPTSFVSSVAISADGRRALCGDYGGTLCLWDTNSGECLGMLKANADRVTSMALSADGRHVIAGAGFGIDTWDLDSGRHLHITSRNSSKVASVALSVDGRWALSGNEDATACLWDLDNGACFTTLRGHIKEVTTVALSSDGRRALSGSRDHTLRLWDLDNGECLRTLEGHTDKVESVALSADGRWALSGSQDTTLRLWDLNLGVCIRTLEDHCRAVVSVALRADGCQALSGGEDKTLRLWDLEWDYAFPEPQDWDEGARPYLRNFLVLRAPEATFDSPTGGGRPTWDEAAWEQLQHTLCDAGYGWLRPEGVRRELQRMAEHWPSQQ